MAAQVVVVALAIAVVGALLMLLFLRSTDEQTRLLCRDVVRRLGAGYRFVPGAGLKPNRIVGEAPAYRLEAELSPGRRVGWRLDVALEPRGAEYLEPYGEGVRALLDRGRYQIPGRTRIERSAIRHEFVHGATLGADDLAEIIKYLVEIHEKIDKSYTKNGAGNAD